MLYSNASELKLTILQKLILAFKNVKTQLHQEKLDHEREIDYNRHVQKQSREREARIRQYEDEIRQLKDTTVDTLNDRLHISLLTACRDATPTYWR